MRDAMDLELPNGLGDWGEVAARGRPFVVARGLWPLDVADVVVVSFVKLKIGSLPSQV